MTHRAFLTVGIYVGDGWMLDCGDPIQLCQSEQRAIGSPTSTPTANFIDKEDF